MFRGRDHLNADTDVAVDPAVYADVSRADIDVAADGVGFSHQDVSAAGTDVVSNLTIDMDVPPMPEIDPIDTPALGVVNSPGSTSTPTGGG